MKTSLLISAAFVAANTLGAQGNTPACLQYEPDTVQLSGTLARHMYYGAPGFGEDPAHDQREVGFYLDLPRPVCMVAGANDVDVPKSGIRRVQLILDEQGYARLRPFVGKRVALRGTLLGAFTGHHHTPVLLRVLTPAHVDQ